MRKNHSCLKTVIGVIAVLLAVALVVVGIVMENRKRHSGHGYTCSYRPDGTDQPSGCARTAPIYRQNRRSPNRQTPKIRAVRKNPKESRM